MSKHAITEKGNMDINSVESARSRSSLNQPRLCRWALPFRHREFFIILIDRKPGSASRRVRNLCSHNDHRRIVTTIHSNADSPDSCTTNHRIWAGHSVQYRERPAITRTQNVPGDHPPAGRSRELVWLPKRSRNPSCTGDRYLVGTLRHCLVRVATARWANKQTTCGHAHRRLRARARLDPLNYL